MSKKNKQNEYCKILNVNINILNMDKTKELVDSYILNKEYGYICVSNVHTTVMSYENNDYRDIQNNALLRLPDGGPLSVVSRIYGHKNAQRVTGPDLMEEIFKDSVKNKYKHYFYGGKQETLDLLKEKLKDKYKAINIVGMYSPPFRDLTFDENEEIVKMINSSGADIIWVGLGAPKQEIWMNKNSGKVSGLMIGVGAGFDYFAGNIKRAPSWMQKYSLEWLYRLIQEPRRLFKRYFVTNSKFLFYLARKMH